LDHPFYRRLSREQIGVLNYTRQKAPKFLKPKIIVEINKENKFGETGHLSKN